MGSWGVSWEEELVERTQDAADRSAEVSREEVNDRIHNRVEIHRRRAYPVINPLPIKNGLNPTRAQVPLDEGTPVKAYDFISRVISAQRHRHPDDDETAVFQRFSDGLVVLDSGEPVSPDALIPPGRFLNFYRRPAPEREVPGTLDLLYEDNDLLVVDKPPFLATLPRGQHIAQTALTKARIQFGISELSPCHRLDRLTRGVLMFTKRPEIRGAYQTMFDRREPKKIYEAITDIPQDPPSWLSEKIAGMGDTAATAETISFEPPLPGGAPGSSGSLSAAEKPCLEETPVAWQEGFYGESPAPTEVPRDFTEIPSEVPWRLRPAPTANRPWILRHHMIKIRGRLCTYISDGKPNAETAVTGVRAFIDTTSTPRPTTRLAWRLEPHSGRTHQLRVVMRSLGMPIVNDSLYGFISTDALLRPDGELPKPLFVADEDFSRPMGLIARQLSFKDPLSNDHREFSSKL